MKKLFYFVTAALLSFTLSSTFSQGYTYYPYGGDDAVPFTVPNAFTTSADLDSVWKDPNVMVAARFDQVHDTLPTSISQDSSKTYINAPDAANGNTSISGYREISEASFSRSFAWNVNPDTYENNYGVGFNYTVNVTEAGDYNLIIRTRSNTSGAVYLFEVFDFDSYDQGPIQTITANTAGLGVTAGAFLAEGTLSNDGSAMMLVQAKAHNLNNGQANSHWSKILEPIRIDSPKKIVLRITNTSSSNGASLGGFTFFKAPIQLMVELGEGLAKVTADKACRVFMAQDTVAIDSMAFEAAAASTYGKFVDVDADVQSTITYDGLDIGRYVFYAVLNSDTISYGRDTAVIAPVMYTGKPFYADTTLVFPGDHFAPMFFDLGDSGVVYTASTARNGSGGFDSRTSNLYQTYGDSVDTYGRYFLFNGGNKTLREAPQASSLYFTAYFTEAGYYKVKNWNGGRDAMIYLYTPENVSMPVDTLKMVGGVNTGEYAEAAGSRQWKLYSGDSLHIAQAGKYILRIDLGGALGNGDNYGAFAFYTNEQFAAGEDLVMAGLTSDTTYIYYDGSINITSDMDGELYIVKGNGANDETFENHKGLLFAEVLLNEVQKMSVTANTPVSIDMTGAVSTVGDTVTFAAVVRTANGNTSKAYSFEVRPVPSGINNISMLNVAVYPNPAKESVTIDLTHVKNASVVELVNLVGQVVYTENVVASEKMLLNTSKLNGVYFVRVQNETGSFIQKLIVK